MDYKSYKDMTFEEKVNWVTGGLILGIGEGKFRDAVAVILAAVSKEAYDRGLAEGKKKPAKRAYKRGF